MNRYSWFVQTINMASFLLVGLTAFFLLDAIFSPPPEPDLPSVEGSANPGLLEEKPGEETQGSLPSRARLRQVVANPKLGPKLKKKEQEEKAPEPNCDASEYVKSIKHIHPTQGVHVVLTGMKKPRYLWRGIYYSIADLKNKKRRENRENRGKSGRNTGPRISFLGIKNKKAQFGFKNLPDQKEEVCRDTFPIPDKVLEEALSEKTPSRNTKSDTTGSADENGKTGSVASRFATEKTSKHRWKVDPDEKKWAKNHIDELLSEVDVSKVIRDGSVYGLRLTGVDEDSLLRKRGIRKNDIIMSVNDRSLKSFSQLKKMAEQDEFSSADTFRVKIERDGRKPFEVTYEIGK